MELLIVVSLICGLSMLARLNYVYWSERRAMTPEQRAKVDAEERDDMQVW